MDDATTRPARPMLLFGGSGQVGRELLSVLPAVGAVIAPRRSDADLTSPESLRDTIRRVKPWVVVNAAALTNVDQAEREPELARAVNEIAPGAIAEAAAHVGAIVVHYSTDYVFGGDRTTPYDEYATPHPISVYGATKLAGERNIAAAEVPHLIIRTSWVYSATGSGFVATLLRDLPAKRELRIVADQVGSPTWSRSLARATAEILRSILYDRGGELRTEDRGVFHLAGSGAASRVAIAEAVLEFLGMGTSYRIVPIPAASFGAAAPRPGYSALSNERAATVFAVRLDPWRAELRRMLADRPT
jgi:dTDP-4-dehydrorhamnose reductase